MQTDIWQNSLLLYYLLLYYLLLYYSLLTPLTPSLLFDKFMSSFPFQGTTGFCHKQRDWNFKDYSALVNCFVHGQGVTWFYSTKAISPSQFMETLKVKTTSIYL